nr:hypothetical protein [Morchella crassipes]
MTSSPLGICSPMLRNGSVPPNYVGGAMHPKGALRARTLGGEGVGVGEEGEVIKDDLPPPSSVIKDDLPPSPPAPPTFTHSPPPPLRGGGGTVKRGTLVLHIAV